MRTFSQILFLLTIYCCGASAGSIFILPSSPTIGLGNAESIDVNVSGLSDLYAFQFDLSFNPSVLAFVSITEGDLFNNVGVSFIPGTIDNTVGTISFIADSLSGPGPGISSNGTLAQIAMTAIGVGSSDINLANVVLLNSGLNDIAAASFGTVISVAGAPEPSSMVLLITGLGVGYFLKRYKATLP